LALLALLQRSEQHKKDILHVYRYNFADSEVESDKKCFPLSFCVWRDFGGFEDFKIRFVTVLGCDGREIAGGL
jgi:hypothetical protein